jgi:hypothetical protein
MIRRRLPLALAFTLAALSVRASGHSGPPFPILSDKAAGPYLISIWTDPDATDDGSAGGQFWVRIHLVGGEDLPSGTRATVSIAPTNRPDAAQTASAAPVRGDITNQFAALVMGHEGPFHVHVSIDGPRGRAAVESSVDATYDLRPPRVLLLIYLVPFVAVGLLWGRLLMRRRALRSPPRG